MTCFLDMTTILATNYEISWNTLWGRFVGGVVGLGFIGLCLLPPNLMAQARQRGGEIVYGEAETVSRFDPYRLETARGASDRIFSLIYEGLVRYDHEEERFILVLAESYETSDDNTSITFKIRPDITWHDGQPFTASDVAFTFDYIKRIAPEQIRRPYGVVTVSVRDAMTVQAVFEEPVPEPLVFFDTWILPAHRYESFLPKRGLPSLEDEPLGTGPYIFRGRTIEGHITLDVNEKYWGEAGNISSLTMNKVTDPNQMVQLAIFDVYKLMVQVPPNQLPLLKESQKFRIEQYASFTIFAFAYNNEHPVLRDSRVRQALTYATDRQQMLDQWFNGEGHLIAGPFNQFSPYFDPTLKPYEHNLDKARALLQEAGLEDRNGDGFLETPRGERVTLELVNFVDEAASSTLNQNIASSYKSDLRAVGIEINPINLTLDDYRKRLFEDNNFDVALVQWTFDPIYDVTDLFQTSAIGGNNIVRFSNSEVDTIIRLFDQQPDPELRIEQMKSMQRVLARENPYTFILSVDKNAAFHRGLSSTRIDPYYFFTYFPQWYIRAEYRN